jgi:hypothetical protein
MAPEVPRPVRAHVWRPDEAPHATVVVSHGTGSPQNAAALFRRHLG